MPEFWRKRNIISYLLWPFSLLFQGIVVIRRYLYKKNIFKVTRLSVPVIVVGNITVGGTGKTPLVIWLAEFLHAQGFKPGIVSRGYGGKSATYPQWVTAQNDPQQVGDEPVLIALRTQCPLVVDPNRVRAAQTLLQKSDCNIIISDDGLQHYALARDIEMACIDAERGFGNGFCLPAGPLREPTTRLQTVDFIFANDTWPKTIMLSAKIDGVYNLADPSISKPLTEFSQQTIHAVAGIGNPQRFFDLLLQQDIAFIPRVFRDHHKFSANDIDIDQDETLIMTEKDAVKCRQFADWRHWVLQISLDVDDSFGKALLEKLAKCKNVGV